MSWKSIWNGPYTTDCVPVSHAQYSALVGILAAKELDLRVRVGQKTAKAFPWDMRANISVVRLLESVGLAETSFGFGGGSRYVVATQKAVDALAHTPELLRDRDACVVTLRAEQERVG